MNNILSKIYDCPEETHHVWNNQLEPQLLIRSGDVVNFHFKDVSNMQLNLNSVTRDWVDIDKGQLHPLCGPIYIEDAKPGDTLEVEILDLQTKGWGWTAIIPGKGLLQEEFHEPYLRTFDLSNKTFIRFNEHISIPIKPFLGTMGVAPEANGNFPIIPPGDFGGNMDIRHLTKGSRLFLPIKVNGALFSAGDAHAAQGDGEVCINGVESPMFGQLRFTLHKGVKSDAPYLYTSSNPSIFADSSKGFFVTTGNGLDLFKCSQDAISRMIDYLAKEHGLDRRDAYILCSLTVDLKISQIVNKPNYVVSAYIPLSIFN